MAKLHDDIKAFKQAILDSFFFQSLFSCHIFLELIMPGMGK